MKIDWTEPARNDLESIYQYILRDSEYYAKRFVWRILEIIDTLSDFPDMGRVVPEASRVDIREILFSNYRIIYRREADRILLLAIIHQARDLSKKETPPWE